MSRPGCFHAMLGCSHRPIDVHNIYNAVQVKLLMRQQEFDDIPEFDKVFRDEDEVHNCCSCISGQQSGGERFLFCGGHPLVGPLQSRLYFLVSCGLAVWLGGGLRQWWLRTRGKKTEDYSRDFREEKGKKTVGGTKVTVRVHPADAAPNVNKQMSHLCPNSTMCTDQVTILRSHFSGDMCMDLVTAIALSPDSHHIVQSAHCILWLAFNCASVVHKIPVCLEVLVLYFLEVAFTSSATMMFKSRIMPHGWHIHMYPPIHTLAMLKVWCHVPSLYYRKGSQSPHYSF